MRLAVKIKENAGKITKRSLSILLAVSIVTGSLILPVSAYAKDNVTEDTAKAVEMSQQAMEEVLSVTDIREYEDNEVLVVYKKAGTHISQLPVNANKEEVTEKCALIELDTKKELRETIAVLREDDSVGYIQPNYTYSAYYTNDTYSDRQWAYFGNYNIGIQNAWNKGAGVNKEVIVAVIDVGVDYNHEDLSTVMWINEDEIPDDGEDNDGNGYIDDIYGYNFFDNDSVVCDYVYSETESQYVEDHGTHVAGIIAAVADNGKGVAGVASYSNVKIMSLKVLGDDQNGFGIKGSTSDIISAVKYAENNGALICNMSFGYTSFDTVLYQTMAESNMLFVCAAGNGVESTDWYGWSIDEKPEYPAAFDLDNIISVANMNETGYIDSSSCYGETSVDIAAPGTKIASTVVAAPSTYYRESKYQLLTGTSMAAPMVAGTAAYVASYYGCLTALEIKEAVLEGASVNTNFANKVSGNRMLNVPGALNYYANSILTKTEISAASKKSNNKVIATEVSYSAAPVKTVAYAEGEQPLEYFNGGTQGTVLECIDNRFAFEVAKTGVYTIYILCEDGTETVKQVEVEVPVITKLILSTKQKTMKVGKTYKLKTLVMPEDLYVKVAFESSNPEVAKVNAKGKITAKKSGTAKIIVTVNDGNTVKQKKCKIKVKE